MKSAFSEWTQLASTASLVNYESVTKALIVPQELLVTALRAQFDTLPVPGAPFFSAFLGPRLSPCQQFYNTQVVDILMDNPWR